MSDVFLSYARDDKERARKLAQALESRGWSVWWDVEIPPGKTFDQVIEEALAEARCVIVLWSEKSVRSDWVKTEASEGRDRGILVPVLIDRVKIPLAFRRIQAADLVDWFATGEDEDFRLFEDTVAALVGRPGEPAPRPVATPVRKDARDGRRKLILAGAALVVLALLAILVVPKLVRSLRKTDRARPAAADSVDRVPADEGAPADAGSVAPSKPDEATDEAAHGDIRPAVFRVEIAPGRFGSHGFVASQGYLIAMSQGIDEGKEQVAVTWKERGERVRALARVVRRGPHVTLLRLSDRSPPGREPVIRSSVSLEPGEPIVRYLGPTDTTPGRVKEVGVFRGVTTEVGSPPKRVRALITTNISASGDAGAPVLDKEGRVVAMVYAGSQTESISIPIEDLRNAFPEAF